MDKSKKILQIYTDGSCDNITGKGSYSYLVLDYDKHIVKKKTKSFIETTSNRCELMFVISSLQWLLTEPIQVDTITSYNRIEILCDSEYVLYGVKHLKNWQLNNWFGNNQKKIINTDLWKKMFILIPNFNNLVFIKIKSHSGDIYNELVDRMATEARMLGKGVVDIEYIKYKEEINKCKSSTIKSVETPIKSVETQL